MSVVGFYRIAPRLCESSRLQWLMILPDLDFVLCLHNGVYIMVIFRWRVYIYIYIASYENQKRPSHNLFNLSDYINNDTPI